MSKKAKQKRHFKNQEIESKLKSRLENLLISKSIPSNFILPLTIVMMIIPAAIAAFYLYQSQTKNGFFGFPLDDPWIHLTFAKNLIEYGSFSYYRNEIITSGSTSPIYTILLSIFYFISKNEYIISYILGIGFWSASVWLITKLFNLHFGQSKLLTLSTLLLIAIQPKLNLISVSGMETTMFIFFMVGSIYYYKNFNKWLLGLFLGLSIWCRPDGTVLLLAILIDFFLMNKFSSENHDRHVRDQILKKKDFLFSLGVGIGLILIYFIFNYSLSGSILPNTYKAKLEYYQNSLRENFIKNDVVGYFTTLEFIAIVIPFLLAAVVMIVNLLKKKHDDYLVYLIFILGLVAAYYIQLPFAHRFGRYLMPIIPFYFLISIYGLIQIVNYVIKKSKSTTLGNILFVLFIGLTMIFSFTNNSKYIDEYTELCKYHNQRHVAAGLWINKNTPKDAIIATHDIGAIGFYGDRKLVDIVGLVTPELIQHLNDKNFSTFIKQYLTNKNVNYIAALKNWFEVVNDNPLYVPINQFEVMEIYEYKRNQTHIQIREASYINEQAIQLVQRNDYQNAIRYLQQSLTVDPNSSRTYFLIGVIYEMAKDNISAEKFLENAIKIFPNYLDANFALARVKYSLAKVEDSKRLLENCIRVDPNYKEAQIMLEKMK
jgi:tetratricopeptide (TPR) repeat protein